MKENLTFKNMKCKVFLNLAFNFNNLALNFLNLKVSTFKNMKCKVFLHLAFNFNNFRIKLPPFKSFLSLVFKYSSTKRNFNRAFHYNEQPHKSVPNDLKHNSYSAKFKITVLNYIKNNGNFNTLQPKLP
jgi:hypothetical protein